MDTFAPYPSQLQPREKLCAQGASSLSDELLLAIILGSGSSHADVHKLSKSVLEIIDTKNGSLTAKDLAEVKGIGIAKASSICAALEFARRRIRPEGISIRSAADVYPLLGHLGDRKQEHFICISLNGAHEVIAIRTITIGLLNSCQIHPREVFAEPISDRAAAIIVAHNHPSGQTKPSSEDIEITKKLSAAGQILGINLLDHIIFTKANYLSLKDTGLM